MESFISDSLVTALATVLLVAVGVAQVVVLIAQKRQASLSLATIYYKRWKDEKHNWGKVVFISREAGEYYQVVDKNALRGLTDLVQKSNYNSPTIWAIESVQAVCGVMSEVCLRILEGQLSIGDAYPIFDIELLRHSKPMRNILDTMSFSPNYSSIPEHDRVRNELQTWLIYHDGIRRRCLIL